MLAAMLAARSRLQERRSTGGGGSDWLGVGEQREGSSAGSENQAAYGDWLLAKEEADRKAAREKLLKRAETGNEEAARWVAMEAASRAASSSTTPSPGDYHGDKEGMDLQTRTCGPSDLQTGSDEGLWRQVAESEAVSDLALTAIIKQARHREWEQEVMMNEDLQTERD